MIKRNVLVFAGLAILGTANATTPGGYLGIGIGVAELHSYGKAGGIGRLFGGYNFNQNFGIESSLIGYAGYTPNFGLASLLPSTSIEYSMNAFTLVGKGYLPLGNSHFNLYALGGAALVNSTIREEFAFSPTVTTTKTGVRPMYGAGMSYAFTQHVSTQLELSQIYGTGSLASKTNVIPTINLIMLNLAYNF